MTELSREDILEFARMVDPYAKSFNAAFLYPFAQYVRADLYSAIAELNLGNETLSSKCHDLTLEVVGKGRKIADLVAENERLKLALADTEALELGTAERLATTRTKLAAAEANNERLKALSVTNIMVDVVPGDGSGLEVYAKSVDEVVNLLSELGEKAEDLESVRAQLTATWYALAATQAREVNLRDALDNHSGNYKLSKDECAKVNALLDAPRDDSALREMIAGVYEECAKVCDVYPGAEPWEILGWQEGIELCTNLAYAIRALAEKAKRNDG